MPSTGALETAAPQSVEALADGLFERASHHTGLYAEDSRRVNSSGSLILVPHESYLTGPGHRHGRLVMELDDHASMSAFIGAAINSSLIDEKIKSKAELDHDALQESKAADDNKGWRFMGFLPPLLSAMREHDGPWVGLMKGAEPGLVQHSVGFSFKSLFLSGYEDGLMQKIHEVSFTLGAHDGEGPGATTNLKTTRAKDWEPERSWYESAESPLTEQSVREFGELLIKAGEIRPYVMAIEKQQKYMRFLSGLIQGILEPA